MLKRLGLDAFLLITLVFLFGLPFGVFPLLQVGVNSPSLGLSGAVLSASQQNFGGHLLVTEAPLKVTLVKKVYFTLFFGQEAVYENLASLTNPSSQPVKYRLMLLDRQGKSWEGEELTLYFGDQPSQAAVDLGPGETVSINLKVAVPGSTQAPAQESLTLAVLEE